MESLYFPPLFSRGGVLTKADGGVLLAILTQQNSSNQKNIMQKYISIDDFIENQEIKFQILIKRIQHLIMVSHPKMKEKFSFNTAMYECNDLLCYIGKIQKHKGIEIGFVKGFLLSNSQGLLDLKGRRYTTGITFRDIEDFNEKEEAFLEILHEAIILNEDKNTPKFWGLAFAQKKKP
jgi:hypothetical protein